jgi:hypothetical protein
MVAVAGTFKDTITLLVWKYSLKGVPMRFPLNNNAEIIRQ